MVPSVEIFDPRLGSWTIGEPMKNPRGYFAAGAVKESICVIGGIRVGENIVDTVSYIFCHGFPHAQFVLGQIQDTIHMVYTLKTWNDPVPYFVRHFR